MMMKVLATKEEEKDHMMLKMQMDVYMLPYKNWIEELLHWKTYQSRLYALILLHCPPDLEENIKTMSAWNAISNR